MKHYHSYKSMPNVSIWKSLFLRAVRELSYTATKHSSMYCKCATWLAKTNVYLLHWVTVTKTQNMWIHRHCPRDCFYVASTDVFSAVLDVTGASVASLCLVSSSKVLDLASSNFVVSSFVSSALKVSSAFGSTFSKLLLLLQLFCSLVFSPAPSSECELFSSEIIL